MDELIPRFDSDARGVNFLRSLSLDASVICSITINFLFLF